MKLPPIESRDYYFSHEVRAKLGGITPVTLCHWIREKKIPVDKPGRRCLFPKAKFQKWFEEQNFARKIQEG